MFEVVNLLIKDLGLIGSRLALIIPGAVSTFNLMIMITGLREFRSLWRNRPALTGQTDVEDVGLTIKYATIIVSTVPILCIYPFIQKHFVKGVMIGAVKE